MPHTTVIDLDQDSSLTPLRFVPTQWGVCPRGSAACRRIWSQRGNGRAGWSRWWSLSSTSLEPRGCPGRETQRRWVRADKEISHKEIKTSFYPELMMEVKESAISYPSNLCSVVHAQYWSGTRKKDKVYEPRLKWAFLLPWKQEFSRVVVEDVGKTPTMSLKARCLWRT